MADSGERIRTLGFYEMAVRDKTRPLQEQIEENAKKLRYECERQAWEVAKLRSLITQTVKWCEEQAEAADYMMANAYRSCAAKLKGNT